MPCSDRDYDYQIAGTKIVSRQEVHRLWSLASDDQQPFPSDGVQFDTEKQYKLKKWCCYDAAKEVASAILDAEQLSDRNVRRNKWCTYNELCQSVRPPR